MNETFNDCEEVKYHTRQKHAFLQEYLRIWTDRVGVKPSGIPTLEIYDLYAGFGRCYCPENDKSWDGSGLLSAKCLLKYPRSKKLWLNSFQEDPIIRPTQYESIKKHIRNLDLSPEIDVRITHNPIVDILDDVIDEFDPKFPSIWILDPYNPSDLPWFIIDRIANLVGQYTTKSGPRTRRPELFITLMTSSLARVCTRDDGQEDMITQALGISKDIWHPLLKAYRDADVDAQSAFIDIYGKRLTRIYGKEPIAFRVRGIPMNQVYTVFLIAEHNAGYYVMKSKGMPVFQEWVDHKWIPEAKLLAARRGEQRSASSEGYIVKYLDDY